MDIERVEKKLRSIAARREIAGVMRDYGITGDPHTENSLREHFVFLLRCGLCYTTGPTEALLLKGLSKPDWLRRSLEMRRSGASKEDIAWALTYNGKLIM